MTPANTLELGAVRVRIPRPAVLELAIGPFVSRTTFGKEPLAVDVNLGDNQFTTLRLRGLDAANLAGQFVKPPVWTIADPSIATLEVAPDGTSAVLSAAEPAKLGTTLVQINDADDPSVPAVTINVTVGPEPISHLEVTVDPPTEKTPPGTPEEPAPGPT